MANTLKFGNGEWYGKKDTILAYNDENSNFKPLPFSFDRASSATVINKAGLIETVGSGEPRIDYKDDSKGALLLEPSRSNLITYSEDFSQSDWSKQSSGVASAPIITSNYAISPDGTLNADRVVFDINGGTTSSDFSQVAESVTSSIGDVTNSVYIKSNTASNYNISFVNAFGGSLVSIVVTPEWQRFDVTSTTVSTSSVLKLRLRGSEATSDYADVSVWGAQVEQGSYATSYIPTQGSAVTRVAESCNNSANEQVINDSEGVLYAEISALYDDGIFRYITLSDGTTSNRVIMRYTSVSNRIDGIIIVGGVTSALLTYTSPDVTVNSKISVKWKVNDFALWVDGIERASDLSGVSFTANTLNVLNLTNAVGTGSFFHGNVKDVRVYNTALTDAELQALTT